MVVRIVALVSFLLMVSCQETKENYSQKAPGKKSTKATAGGRSGELPVFSNSNDCEVEKENRNKGVILYISKGDEKEIVGYGNQYEFGDFAYCAADKTEINVSEDDEGTEIVISCKKHQNGHAVTRGKAEISLDTAGNPTKIKVDGQRKRLLGWKQDVKFECSDLVEE